MAETAVRNAGFEIARKQVKMYDEPQFGQGGGGPCWRSRLMTFSFLPSWTMGLCCWMDWMAASFSMAKSFEVADEIASFFLKC